MLVRRIVLSLMFLNCAFSLFAQDGFRFQGQQVSTTQSVVVEEAESAQDEATQPTPLPQPATQEEVYTTEMESEPLPQAHAGHAHGNSCSSCRGRGCGLCRLQDRQGPGCNPGFYAHAEYLYWWTDGMFVPALVTTSPPGTPRVDAGVLGVPGTETLFGDTGINKDGRPGMRVTMGYWLGNCRAWGVEGDYFYLGDAADSFSATSLGTEILSRPYYDIKDGTENAELVSFPNVLSGTVSVDALTRYMGAGLRGRWNICACDQDCDPFCGNACFTDFTMGYRYLRLDDELHIREDLFSLDTANPGAFIVQDQFNTFNQFHGLEFGVIYTKQRGPWSINFTNRISLGTTLSRVEIDGSTESTSNGISTLNTGGLLTQRTNIGVYERDSFTVAPELGMTLGYQLTPVWKLTIGYDFIYWSSVIRAGHQIDRDINEDLIPPELANVTGPLRPLFRFNDTDFWSMGINLGLNAQW